MMICMQHGVCRRWDHAKLLDASRCGGMSMRSRVMGASEQQNVTLPLACAPAPVLTLWTSVWSWDQKNSKFMQHQPKQDMHAGMVVGVAAALHCYGCCQHCCCSHSVPTAAVMQTHREQR